MNYLTVEEPLPQRSAVVRALAADGVDGPALPDQNHATTLEVAQEETPFRDIGEGHALSTEIGTRGCSFLRAAHARFASTPDRTAF